MHGSKKIPEIGIATFLQHVRDELEQAEERRQESGKKELFSLQDIELELSFTVSEDITAKGGLSIKVISVEAGGGLNSATVHKAKLTLTISESAKRDKVLGARPYPSSERVVPV